MRVGFTGTREGMTAHQKAAVRALLVAMKPVEAHHGDCVGADADFHDIAQELLIPIVIHPPTDSRLRAYCSPSHRMKDPRPHLDRNHDIVDATDFLIATPKEQVGEVVRSGTWATVRYARKLDRNLAIVRPEFSE